LSFYIYSYLVFVSSLLYVLLEALHCAGERADDLEVKLKASEEAHERAEKDAVSVEDLRQRLQASEDALSDKEAKFIQRENDIITRLETQSRRFTSNIVFLACDSALVLKVCLDVDLFLLFSSRENG
jgi:preprotein translocase subunit SecF